MLVVESAYSHIKVFLEVNSGFGARRSFLSDIMGLKEEETDQSLKNNIFIRFCCFFSTADKE